MINVRLLFTMVLVCMISMSGCVEQPETSPKQAAAQKHVFYPPLPNQPRYQYLTTFSNSRDLAGKKSGFYKFVVGEEEKVHHIVKPYGVTMADGKIFVCDLKRSAVEVLDIAKGTFTYLGTEAPGRLINPVNIVHSKADNLLYVTDMALRQVLVYQLDGTFVRAYGKEGQFHPGDVCVYKDRLYVCDVRGHQIHVLDLETGDEIRKFGERGGGHGQFHFPTNIKIHDDVLYVSDLLNYRVQLLTLTGKYITSFGQVGDTPGTFSRPKGIDVDREGRIYVVDAAFQNLQVFNKEHQLLLYFLGTGDQRDNIMLPADVHVDYDHVAVFSKYMDPRFQAEYLVLVTSNFGPNKVNVYAFGEYQNP